MLELFNKWEVELVKEELDKGNSFNTISSMLSDKTADDCKELALLKGWIKDEYNTSQNLEEPETKEQIIELREETDKEVQGRECIDLGIENVFREKKLLEISTDFIKFYNKGVTNNNILLKQIEKKYNLPSGYGFVLQNLIWGSKYFFRCLMQLQQTVKGISGIEGLEKFIYHLKKEILIVLKTGKTIQDVSQKFEVDDRLIYSFLQREFGSTDVDYIKKLDADFQRPTVYSKGKKQEYIEKMLKRYTYVSEFKDKKSEIPAVEGNLFEKTPETYDENDLFKRNNYAVTMQDYYDILGISEPNLNFEYLDYLLKTKKIGETLKYFITKHNLKDYIFYVELRAKLLGRELYNCDVDYYLIEDILVDNFYGELGDSVQKLIAYFIPQEYYKPKGYYTAIAFEKKLELNTHPSFISIKDFERLCITVCGNKGLDITTLTPWYSQNLCSFIAAGQGCKGYSMEYYLQFEEKSKRRTNKIDVRDKQNLLLSDEKVYNVVTSALNVFDKLDISYEDEADILIGKDRVFININSELMYIWSFIPKAYNLILKTIKEYSLNDFDSFWTYEKDKFLEGNYKNLDYETWEIHSLIEGSTIETIRERARVRGLKRGYTEKEEKYLYNELIKIGDIGTWSQSIEFRTPKALEMRIKDEYCLMAIKEVKELRKQIELLNYQSNGVTAENFKKLNEQIREELEHEIRNQERQKLIETSASELLRIKHEKIKERKSEIDRKVDEIVAVYKVQKEQEVLNNIDSAKLKEEIELRERNRLLDSIDKEELNRSILNEERLKILSEIDTEELKRHEIDRYKKEIRERYGEEIKKVVKLDLEKEVYQEIIEGLSKEV